MVTNVQLTPELERFAEECVAEGRYRDVSDVVRSGLRLLQEVEQQRAELEASLREAEEEADRDGTFSIEEVLAEMDAIIEKHQRWPMR